MSMCAHTKCPPIRHLFVSAVTRREAASEHAVEVRRLCELAPLYNIEPPYTEEQLETMEPEHDPPRRSSNPDESRALKALLQLIAGSQHLRTLVISSGWHLKSVRLPLLPFLSTLAIPLELVALEHAYSELRMLHVISLPEKRPPGPPLDLRPYFPRLDMVYFADYEHWVDASLTDHVLAPPHHHHSWYRLPLIAHNASVAADVGIVFPDTLRRVVIQSDPEPYRPSCSARSLPPKFGTQRMQVVFVEPRTLELWAEGCIPALQYSWYDLRADWTSMITGGGWERLTRRGRRLEILFFFTDCACESFSDRAVSYMTFILGDKSVPFLAPVVFLLFGTRPGKVEAGS
ncbi:hypothetical protein FISHEDRAFT_55162 [Fistulina hepatica ATCC 64428]|uniref:Uncharacterized protein n=1 Tax=Fistulina hepatica ATCC 64428 TaxID=1128425 RepID=A0A0D7ANI3_9AGAR|nr:hypothetical protein FISHEDRAFT_55162 [Fistulina hepatica ATCC 64428]